jgi:chloramphenicol 3-O-phosphotransferase
MTAKASGQIIIVNGSSGTGKSTTCAEFIARQRDPWLLLGIDQFLGSIFPRRYGHHGDRSAQGIQAVPIDPVNPEGPQRWQFGDYATRGFEVFHDWIASASRAGCSIIVDHLLIQDPPILQDCIWRLEGLPVLCVNLKPPQEVLMERVAQRDIGARFSTSNYNEQQIARSKMRLEQLRPWFYEAVYHNDCFDIEIDTALHAPDRVCEQIEQRLEAGPGSAFSTLRGRYAKPAATTTPQSGTASDRCEESL